MLNCSNHLMSGTLGPNWTSCGCKNFQALYNWLMLRLSLLCFIYLWRA
jgi:hypothetical protein